MDECTSGFRQTLGGIHKNYNVNPDIITYGKAIVRLCNYYTIVGNNKVMKACDETFISSTGQENRVIAALETIKIMKKKNLEKLKKRQIYKTEVEGNCKKHNLEIAFGIDSIPQFKFKKNNNILKHFNRSNVKKNILANNTIYT